MNILVSNDDGIQATGIARLAEALSAVGDVYVVAPDGQRSASSHALSIGTNILITEVEEYPYAKRAFMVGGTPADCVKMGANLLEEQGIHVDMVVTGINHGSNLGTDVMYSGTVSAAAEGAMLGLPALAVSVNEHHPKHFDGACKAALMVLDRIYQGGGNGALYSINAPDCPADQVKGLKPALLGRVEYDEWFHRVDQDRNTMTYHYSGEPIVLDEWTDEMDTRIIRDGYATISRVKYDLNDYQGFEDLKTWKLEW